MERKPGEPIFLRSFFSKRKKGDRRAVSRGNAIVNNRGCQCFEIFVASNFVREDPLESLRHFQPIVLIDFWKH